jgi:TetR/AcrR family transcriptional repressor of lmrAB and yxaGH operons
MLDYDDHHSQQIAPPILEPTYDEAAPAADDLVGRPGATMADGARERMVRSAVVLLAKRGLPGASLNDVLDHSKAPRGSIYHHFPEGKDQLIAAAVDRAGGNAVANLDALEGRPVGEVVEGFLAMWRAVLDLSGLTAGCSVLAVAVSTDSAELVDQAGEVFRTWQSRLTDLLAGGGLTGADAAQFATVLIAASEGAVVLARAERDISRFDVVAAQLRAWAEHLAS